MNSEDKMIRCDVAVIGGGPAGAATALSLRTHAPALSITLVERSNYGALRIGETLPPTVRPLLEHLGVWPAFEKEGHVPAYGTRAAWGSDDLFENEFIFHPALQGWHLDRARFDALLAGEAARNGVNVIRGAKLEQSVRVSGSRWNLTLRANDGPLLIDARFVVDATGQRASFAKQQGVQKILLDQLIGVFRFFEFELGRALADTYTLVEPWKDGWWYSALVPGNKLAVACMTDADIARQHNLNSDAAWFEMIATTRYTKERIAEAKPSGPLSTHPAFSHRLERVTGDGWVAVGDAASTFDPLSSLGIQKGLRLGIMASYAIGDWFAGLSEGLEKYETMVAWEFESYLTTRSEYYRRERRWETSPFWQRRYDYVTIDPTLTLQANKVLPSESVSLHLSRADLNYLSQLCSPPRPAHEIVSDFGARTKSVSDRRVILALQHLIGEGVISPKSI